MNPSYLEELWDILEGVHADLEISRCVVCGARFRGRAWFESKCGGWSEGRGSFPTMFPSFVRLAKASRLPLTSKMGNKDFYKGLSLRAVTDF